MWCVCVNVVCGYVHLPDPPLRCSGSCVMCARERVCLLCGVCCMVCVCLVRDECILRTFSYIFRLCVRGEGCVGVERVPV